MLTITTTNNLDGYEVVEYLGIVTGEAVSGINMFRDIGAGLRNVFGGRSAGYEDEMAQAREEVLRDLRVGGGGGLTRGGEDGLILHELLDHGRSFLIWAQQILAHSFLSPAELYQMPIKARAVSPQNELN